MREYKGSGRKAGAFTARYRDQRRRHRSARAEDRNA